MGLTDKHHCFTAPSRPRNVKVLAITDETIRISWWEPARANGILQVRNMPKKFRTSSRCNFQFHKKIEIKKIFFFVKLMCKKHAFMLNSDGLGFQKLGFEFKSGRP